MLVRLSREGWVRSQRPSCEAASVITPILQRRTLRSREVPCPRQNSGLYFSGVGFCKSQTAFPSISLFVSLNSKFLYFKQKIEADTRSALPQACLADGRREAERGGIQILLPGIGLWYLILVENGTLGRVPMSCPRKPAIRATLVTAVFEYIFFHREGRRAPGS